MATEAKPDEAKSAASAASAGSALRVGDTTVIEENGKRLTGVVTTIVAGKRMIQWSDGEITEED